MRNDNRKTWHTKNTTIMATIIAVDFSCRLRTYWAPLLVRCILCKCMKIGISTAKDGFKSEDTRKFLHCRHKYSKSLSSAENLNFRPKTVNNLFKFYKECSGLKVEPNMFNGDKKNPLQLLWP